MKEELKNEFANWTSSTGKSFTKTIRTQTPILAILINTIAKNVICIYTI